MSVEYKYQLFILKNRFLCFLNIKHIFWGELKPRKSDSNFKLVV